MPDLMDVNPTRGNLLRLRNELEGLLGRYDLLDRKRKILIQALMARLEKARELEAKSLKRFKKAHKALQMARMRMGSAQIDAVSLAPTIQFQLTVDTHRVMGVKTPVVAMDISTIDPPYGPGNTSASLDQARHKWQLVLRFLAEAAETIPSVWRLALALRKTQRQVNALGHTIIPRYQNTIQYIEDRLEEDEREDIVHAKQIAP